MSLLRDNLLRDNDDCLDMSSLTTAWKFSIWLEEK